jgi:hypothetical protein
VLDRLWIHAQEKAQRTCCTLLKMGSFIVGLTILKWAVTLAGLAPMPVVSFPFCRHAPPHEVLFFLCSLSFRTFSGACSMINIVRCRA